MKKIVSILLAVVITASLSVSTMAATSRETAYKTLIAAQKKLENASSVDFSFAFKLTAEMQGEKLEIPGKGTAQYVLKDGEDPQIAMTVTAMEETIEFYYKDGYGYYNVGGDKYKEAIPSLKNYTELTEAYNDSFSELVKKDMLDTITMEETDEGTKISYKIKKETIKSVLKEMDIDDADARFGNITLSYLLSEDGSIDKITIGFAMAVGTGSETGTVKCVMVAKYRSINKLKSVNYPKDLKSYADAMMPLFTELPG